MPITLDDLYGGTAPVQNTPSARSSGPITLEDLQGASIAPSQGEPSALRAASAGILQGAHDVLDWPAQGLARGAQAIGLTGALNRMGIPAPTAAQTTAADRRAAARYEMQYGNRAAARWPRLAEQTLLVVPALEAGGPMLGGALRGIASALPENAGALVNGLTRFAGGEGGKGLLGRGASKVVGGALMGGAAMGLTGGAEGPRLTDMKGGAMIGAGLGGALPIAGGIARSVASLGSKAFPEVFDAAPRVMRGVQNKLVQALARDGLTPEAFVNRLADLGPDATAADAGGRNVQALAESVASMPGRGADLAQQTLEGRAETQPERLIDAVREATGTQGGYHDIIESLMRQRAQEAAPLYEKAFSAPVTSTRLQQFLNHPLVKKGLQQGIEVEGIDALTDNKPFDPNAYGMKATPEGDLELVGVPNMRTLDAAKSGLDDLIEKYRDPTTGKLVLDRPGRSMNRLKNAMLAEMDRLNPDYAAARAAYAGPSAAIDVMQMGRRALNNDAEITAKTLGGLSPGDRQFFKVGLARALEDKIASSPDDTNAVRKIFGNSLIRKKLQAAFGDPQAFSKFEAAMEREALFADTRNQVLKGSQTARRLAGQQDVGINALPHALRAFSGDFRGGALGMLGEGYQAVTRPSEARTAALGNALFTPAHLEELRQLLNRPLSVGQRVGNRLVEGGRLLAAPGGALLLTPHQ